jgi:hypothetical protein
MVEIADIFRIHGPDYRAKFGNRMPPSHARVMQRIEQCRTLCLGGQLYFCPQCKEHRYSYHSCKDRHCPKCQNDQAEDWLEQQKNLLLPVAHFMVTFTLPAELRPLARSHQKTIYNILFRASAEALQQLALDPRFVGGRIGMIGVLHTWTRDLRYHPHVHYIVPGGGLTLDGQWKSSKEDFLVHVKPLSLLFRAKFRDLLKKTDLFSQVDPKLWDSDWVVHCKPVGSGLSALKYLAPYIFRVAISNNRIVKLEDGKVTFKYKDSATDQLKFATVPAEQFIRRFLQHVLPKGFVKVRYYGLFACGNRPLLDTVRKSLNKTNPSAKEPLLKQSPEPLRCPRCSTDLILVLTLDPQPRSPPQSAASPASITVFGR